MKEKERKEGRKGGKKKIQSRKGEKNILVHGVPCSRGKGRRECSKPGHTRISSEGGAKFVLSVGKLFL